MDFFKRNRAVILSLIAILGLIGSVFIWNDIVEKQNSSIGNVMDDMELDDFNNVSIVDAKLNGEDYKITQSYLFNYTKHKSSIWYMTKGYVDRIVMEGEDAKIMLKENKDSENSFAAVIAREKMDVKVGDMINVVGTIDLKLEELHLSKVSKDDISYSSVVEMDLHEIINNINLIKETFFVVSGYMVTDGDMYKLYDDKNKYKEQNEGRNYFLIQWAEDFMYTGNQGVTLRCLIEDTYVLKNCELQ